MLVEHELVVACLQKHECTPVGLGLVMIFVYGLNNWYNGRNSWCNLQHGHALSMPAWWKITGIVSLSLAIVALDVWMCDAICACYGAIILQESEVTDFVTINAMSSALDVVC